MMDLISDTQLSNFVGALGDIMRSPDTTFIGVEPRL